MSSTELLCQIIGVNPQKLSKEENLILEAELYVRICSELEYMFQGFYKDYFEILKFNNEKECQLMYPGLVRCLINDILSTENYTLDGIAYYTETPPDVVYELAIGNNINPSAFLLRKIIELHKTVRKELYEAIMKKIISEAPATH